MSSINNEISIINTAKSNLATALINKFGMLQSGFYLDSACTTMKRLTDWTTLVTSATVSTTNALTFSNSGNGAASGTTFDGSTGVIISHNSIGALSLGGGTMTGDIDMNEHGLTNVNAIEGCGVHDTVYFDSKIEASECGFYDSQNEIDGYSTDYTYLVFGSGQLNAADETTVGYATSLVDTGPKTAWGLVYWSSGQPLTISGNMTGIGANMEWTANNSRTAHIYFDQNAWWVGIVKDGTTHLPLILWDNSSTSVDDCALLYELYAMLTGNIGIGTQDPSYKLDVVGSIHCTTGGFTDSDIRYKNVLENIELTTLDIANLPLFKYTWKNKEDDNIHIGSSALAVEEIMPELVSGDKFKALDYATLGVAGSIIACRKINEQEEEIKALKEKIKILEEKINGL